MTGKRGLRSYNGHRLVLAGSGVLTHESRLGFDVDAEGLDGTRWTFRCAYRGRRLYLAYDEYGQVVGEFSRPLLFGRTSSLTWCGTDFDFTPSSLLRKDWSLYDGGETEILSVHAHSMIGKHKVSLQRTDAPVGAQNPNGLELFCSWLATRFSLERIRLAGA